MGRPPRKRRVIACKRCGRDFIERSASDPNVYCSSACYKAYRAEAKVSRILSIATQDTDECIEWPYAAQKSGYGTSHLAGKTCPTHRAAYMLVYGELPPDIVVRHKCDNPRCVNIRHLEAGTHKDNQQDCIIRGRKKAPRGGEHYRAILSEEDVRLIRSSTLSAAKLSERLGVKIGAIHRVRQGRNWKHVQ